MRRRYTPAVTRNQRVTRVVYGVYVVIVAAFTISNIAQVGRQIFGANGGAATSAPVKVGAPCAEQLKIAYEAIEIAAAEASKATDAENASQNYVRRRGMGRSPDLDRACNADPNGVEALAALARLDRAAEDHAIRTATELSPVRLSTQSFISGHPQ